MKILILSAIVLFSNYSEAKWTAKDKATLKKELTPEQYKVTQEAGTEQPFKNKYWDNKRAGIYVDVTTG